MDTYAHFNAALHLKIAHYLLFLLLSSSCLHSSTKLLCLGDGLPCDVRCIDEERRALLLFKQDLTDPSGRLSSWIGDDCCCQWKGISCNNRTRHVTKMDLRNPHDVSFPPFRNELYPKEQDDRERSFNYSSLGGKINPSLLSLKHLNYLDLSNNNFDGTHIPKFFGELKSLQYLNLSSASFGGEITPFLGNLSNLNYLDLSYDSISSRNLNWLPRLTSLKYLNLNRVNISSTAVSWLHAVNMIPSLLELHLSSCQIENLPLSLQTINLTSLLVLDISNNYHIPSSFPSWLFNLTSLRKLDLSSNWFTGPIPSELASLKYLEHLDLGFFPDRQIPRFIGLLCKLKVLNLQNNGFRGGIPELLNGFSNCTDNRLESLDLSWNRLGGELPASLVMLHKLQSLDLSYNNFHGSIPDSIRNLSSLRTLDLSYNDMNGTISESLGQLHELVHLDLSWNPWGSNLGEAHFINLTRLQYLGFGRERDKPMSLIFNVTREWVPPFKLHTISIVNCQVGPAFPLWLHSLPELYSITLRGAGISDSLPEDWFLKISSQVKYLDLSHNQIHGRLPFRLAFPNLVAMHLSHNEFDGPLPLWSTNAAILDLATNFFFGPIPSNFDQLMPKVSSLYLSENQLNGIIPPCICNMKYLAVLSLRNNQFSGNLPQTWSVSSDLWVLEVANNNLSGEIPTSMGVLTSLRILKLNNNNLRGKIPFSLQNCSYLGTIDLGGNKFSGNIPLWIGSYVYSLNILRLRSNNFNGHIPQQLCNLPYLQILDLGHNNLTGSIPNCLNNVTTLTDIHYYDYPFPAYDQQTTVTSKGRELEYNRTLSRVRSIDLSSNNLEGEIPAEIGSLFALRILNLSMNQLSGKIPSKIGNLRWLETLDLSDNHLSGPIPQSFSSLTSLSHLNLSYNNLVGRIPLGNQLQTLEDSSIYEGNPSLCGVPLPTKCSGDDDTLAPKDAETNNEDGTDNGVLWFYVSMVVGFVVGFWGVCGTLLVKKSWRYAYFRFFDDIKDKAALAIAVKLARLQRRI